GYLAFQPKRQFRAGVLPLRRRAVVRCYGDRMDAPKKLATIECSVCSAWIEIFPPSEREGPSIAWNMRDEELCKSPPAGRCPRAQVDIRRRFPDFDIGLSVVRVSETTGWVK